MDHKHIETAFFFLILMLAIVLAFFLFLPYLSALILAVTFAVIFYPVQKWIAAFFGGRRLLAALVTLIVILVIVFGPLTFFGIQVFSEAAQLYERIASPEFGVVGSTGQLLPDRVARLLPGLDFDASTAIRGIVGWFSNNVAAIFSGVTGTLLQVFLGILALFYILKDADKIREKVVNIIPLPRESTLKIVDRLHVAITSVMRGSILVALIQGILAGVGFAIFGIPNPAFWGSLTMIASLVPTVGTSLVVVPAIVYLLLGNHFPQAIGLAVWGVVAIGLIDNFLSPKLIERGVKIHPFLILLSVLGGIGLFGPMGFIMGPLVLSLLFALLDIYPSVFSSKRAS